MQSHDTQTPKVSVLLPNLNTRGFLEERLHTIFDQTFVDWELVIVDNYSDDGSWELFQEFAKKDSRIRISQAPRQGMYANWNNCLHLAHGEYVYIATSDDTMSPDCLEKMVTALDAHPECDICHTGLKVIDQQDREIPDWWRHELPVQLYQELLTKQHIRMAPYDGILQCALTIVISVTQMLVRRSVFEKIGDFRTDWGSAGDLEWGMRAGFVCNILHIPETLATWRVYSGQATAEINFFSSVPWAQLCQMIEMALPTLQQYHPEFYKKIKPLRLLFPYRRRQLKFAMQECHGWLPKLQQLTKFMLLSPQAVKEWMSGRIFGRLEFKDDFTYIREEITRLGLADYVKIIETSIH